MEKHRYVQILQKIKERISEGEYKQGQKLPSEIELAKEFQVSRGSVREALLRLEDEGIVIRRHGIGSFVSIQANKIVSGIEKLKPWHEAIHSAGLKAEDRILTIEWAPVSKDEAMYLEVEPQSPGLKIESIRLADDEPIIFTYDILPSHIASFNEVVELRKNTESILSCLDALKKRPQNFVSSIQAVKAGTRLSQLLEIEEDTPLVLLEGVLYDRAGMPLAYSKYFFRSDKYHFNLVRTRELSFQKTENKSRKTNHGKDIK